MVYTPQHVLAALKKKQYAPVYFLQGEEAYYIDLLTSYIANNVLSASEKDFNLTIVYGKDQTMQEILAYARRFPMGSERQVVIVKEAQELQDLHREEGRRLLEAYVKVPQLATLLVWAYKYKTLDARKSLSKLLVRQAVVVSAKKVYDNQIGAWIASYVQERGLSITEKASLMLQAFIGNDLARLAKELNKVCLNLIKSNKIDATMVQTYIGISKSFNAFELQRALVKKNTTKAYQIVRHLAHSMKKGKAIPLVALLFSFFSKLLLVHHAKDKSEQALVSTLQVSPYFVREYLLAAQQYSLTKVLRNIQHLYQADLQLKGIDYPPISEEKIVQELVFKILN